VEPHNKLHFTYSTVTQPLQETVTITKYAKNQASKHILRCISKCLIKHVIAGKAEGYKLRGDEEEDVGSY